VKLQITALRGSFLNAPNYYPSFPFLTVHCRRYSGDNSDNVVSYGTDGGVFQKAGFSVAICGPGSIDQAHKPDEFIEVSQNARNLSIC